jgi:hypothetical protein
MAVALLQPTHAVLWALTRATGLHYLGVNLVGVCAATLWNCAANRRWTWIGGTSTLPAGV